LGGGLSSAEVLAVALVVVAGGAALWATDVMRPEQLVTTGWLRALWAATLLGVVRPLTWLPYLGAFAVARRTLEAVRPDASGRSATIGAHATALAILGGIVAVVLVAVDGAGRVLASTIGFLAGAIDAGQLGTSMGSWTVGPIMWVAAVVVLIRPFLPPVDRDLTPLVTDWLGFPPGERGRIDRLVLWGAAGLAVALGGVALVAAG
jgi:hypothetical protein